MDKDTIIRLAREAEGEEQQHGMWQMHVEDLERFANLIEKKVRDHERAACLEIVEKRGLFDATPKQVEGYNLARDNIAAAIRSRT